MMSLAAVAALVVTVLLALIRAYLGPTVYDRVVAVNAIGTMTVLLIAAVGFLMGRPEFLDIALVYALINFIGTIAVLRYIKRRRARDAEEAERAESAGGRAVIVDILSWISIGIGAAFILVGGLGLVRMPDVFTRLHASSVADTAGAGFILLGFMFQAGLSLNALKLVLIFVFLVFTAPTASHALAHAALLDGIRPWTRKPKDPAP